MSSLDTFLLSGRSWPRVKTYERFTVATVPPVVQNLSLFATTDELNTWQDRSVNGPWKTDGDVGPNSPGDWDRIVTYKNAFMADPTSYLYTGPVEAGDTLGDCVSGKPVPGTPPPHGQGTDSKGGVVSAAAFFALVKQDLAVAQEVATQVVAQINHQDTQFNDRNRWCLIDNALANSTVGMEYGDWLCSHMHAYDMLVAYENAYGANLLTAQQKADYKAWVIGFAEWYSFHFDQFVDELFVDRENDDYTITASGLETPTHSLKVYDGGPRPLKVSIRYHNRNTNGMKAVAVAAAIAQNQTYMDRATKWVKEAVRFAVSRSPWISDFERAMTPNHGQGWSYSTRVVAPMVAAAEIMRQAGDSRAIDFTTTEGSTQTSGNYVVTGEPKSVYTAVDILQRYMNQLEQRTYDGVTIHPGGPDGRWVHDGMYMLIRRSRPDNNEWNTTWTRQHAGAPNFPTNPRMGWFNAWTGDSEMYPAARFCYGPDPV